jgi:hypothetical protein
MEGEILYYIFQAGDACRIYLRRRIRKIIRRDRTSSNEKKLYEKEA